MNKRQLVEKIAERFETTKVNAKDILTTFIAVIEDSLLDGQEVNIHGFGSFKVSKRKARLGYNPKTKERMNINSYTTVAFKPGQPLKDKLSKKFN